MSNDTSEYSCSKSLNYGPITDAQPISAEAKLADLLAAAKRVRDAHPPPYFQCPDADCEQCSSIRELCSAIVRVTEKQP